MQPIAPFMKTATPTLVIGRPHSLWYLTGNPGVGSMDAATSGGVALSSSSALVPGQIRHTDPVSGNAYLARMVAQATAVGQLLLCDRLWHGAWQTTTNAALVVTSTAAQTIGSATLPARDDAGSTNGAGVYVGMEVYATTGAGAGTLTMSYTNSSGNSGKTSGMIDTYVASSAIGAFYRMGLAAGDVGVRSIQTFTIGTSMTSGNVGLVMYRILAQMELPLGNTPNAIDALTGGFQRMYNGTVPFLLFIPGATTASSITGALVESQG